MRRRVLAFVLLTVVAAAVFLVLHFGNFFATATFPPGALNDYLPPDTAAVIAFDLQDLRAKNAQEKPLGKALFEALTKEDIGIPFALLGIDPAADVDLIRLAFTAG